MCYVEGLLLLLLSRFSRVWLCATPETAAHQAPPSLGFSRQEYWSGLPFPSPMHESEKWKWSRSVVSDSLWPHGLQPTRLLCPWIFQARVLEWGAIAFSDVEGLGKSKPRKKSIQLNSDKNVFDFRSASLSSWYRKLPWRRGAVSKRVFPVGTSSWQRPAALDGKWSLLSGSFLVNLLDG